GQTPRIDCGGCCGRRLEQGDRPRQLDRGTDPAADADGVPEHPKLKRGQTPAHRLWGLLRAAA
ncbi:MAG: hypothetical protein IJM24_11050, partial [Clostridia bacterium]|nr:hypothetical protein [Clostridia bacterium]